MSKQFNLKTTANHISEWAASRADTNAMHAILRTMLEDVRLSKADKIEVDHIVVRALAKRYGVVATQAEKNGRLSMLTFAKSQYADDAKMYALYHRAAEALNAARNRFIDPKVKVAASPVEKAKDALAKLLESAEYSSEAKRAVKQLMLLVK